jgi:hypothetical protein
MTRRRNKQGNSATFAAAGRFMVTGTSDEAGLFMVASLNK